MKNSTGNEKHERARAAGAALGRMYANLGSDFGGGSTIITNLDDYEAAVEAKKRAQARARKDHGLEPAPFVNSGCQGEPKAG